jgi:hypothetical protein
MSRPGMTLLHLLIRAIPSPGTDPRSGSMHSNQTGMLESAAGFTLSAKTDREYCTKAEAASSVFAHTLRSHLSKIE